MHADIPEVVQNDITGYLVEERNGEALAEKLIDLIINPKKRELFGIAGRKHIELNYNLDIQIKNLEKIYLSLLNGN